MYIISKSSIHLATLDFRDGVPTTPKYATSRLDYSSVDMVSQFLFVALRYIVLAVILA